MRASPYPRLRCSVRERSQVAEIEQSTFDQLVSQLHSDERNRLLESLAAGRTHSSEDLVPPTGGIAPLTVEEHIATLGGVRRLLYRIASVATARSLHEYSRRVLLRRIGRHLYGTHPQLLKSRHRCSTAEISVTLDRLADSAAAVRDVLDRIVRLRGRQLCCLVAGQNLESMHRALLLATDASRPVYVDLEPSDLRAAMAVRVDELLGEIAPESRAEIAPRVRVFIRLRDLACFDLRGLARMLQSTNQVETLTGPLTKLCSSLYALEAPSLPEISAAVDLDGDTESAEAGDRLEAVDAFISSIRAFGRSIPLLPVARLLLMDPSYVPHPSVGGEEWPVVYRRFWHRRVDRAVRERQLQRRRSATIERASAILPVGPVRTAEDPIRALAAAFLRVLYAPARRDLQILLLSGDFHKSAARRMLTDAISYFDGISAEGDSPSRPPAEAFAGRLSDLSRVLRSILRIGSDDQIDSIANLSAIGGRENPTLRAAWARLAREAQTTSAVVRDLRALENGSRNEARL